MINLRKSWNPIQSLSWEDTLLFYFNVKSITTEISLQKAGPELPFCCRTITLPSSLLCVWINVSASSGYFSLCFFQILSHTVVWPGGECRVLWYFLEVRGCVNKLDVTWPSQNYHSTERDLPLHRWRDIPSRILKKHSSQLLLGKHLQQHYPDKSWWTENRNR